MKTLFISFLLCISSGLLLAQNYTSTTINGISEIAGTGTSVTLSSSTSSAALPIGFSFPFYGNTYTNFYINPTGTISFGVASQYYYSDPPTYSEFNAATTPAMIAFAWMKANFASGVTGYPNFANQAINYFTSGIAPNRVLVVNYKGVYYPYFCQRCINISLCAVQIQLYEGSGKIEVHNTENSSAYVFFQGGPVQHIAVGVKNTDGTLFKDAIGYTSKWNLDNKTVRFLPACPTVTAPTSVTKNPSTSVNPNTSVQLTANGCASGNTVKWEDNSTLNPRTVNPATTTTYSAKCVNGSCESDPTTTTVAVNPPPSYCTSQTLSVTLPPSGTRTNVDLLFVSAGAPTAGCPNGYPVWQNTGGFDKYKIYRDPADCNKWIMEFTPYTSSAVIKATATTASPTDNPPLGESAWVQVMFPNTAWYTTSCNTCTTPTAPTSITKNPATSVNAGTSVTLTANGCASGNTVKWENNTTVNPRAVNPSVTTTYSAKCVISTCESTTTSTTVTVNPPCPTSLVLSSTNNPTDDASSGTILKQANAATGNIAATNKITGIANVTYEAKSIQLNPGFRADGGTVFLVQVGGCN